jgi:hypothetical protein
MKKIIVASIFILFCVVPLSLCAQNSAIDKGSFEFGLGNALGFSLYTGAQYEGDNRITEITIGSGETRLNAGYFIFDKISVGGTTYLSRTKLKGDDDPWTVFVIGPVAKYYYPFREKILFNGKGLIELSVSKAPTATDASTQIAFGVGGAATYLFKEIYGIYGGLDLKFAFNQRSGGNTVDDTGYVLIILGIGLNLYI